MRKAFILDTNVLLNNPNAIFSFSECEVIIPLAVLKELDKHKTRTDEIGKNARAINRILDGYRTDSNLLKGIQLPNKSKLFVKAITKSSFELLPYELKSSSHEVDTSIIAMILDLKSRHPRKTYTLITRDINLRIQCDALGILSENYRVTHTSIDSETELYGGVQRIFISKEKIDQFYTNKGISPEELSSENEIFPNEFLVLKADENSGSAIGKYNPVKNLAEKVIEHKSIFGINPRNKEQNFALNLLLDTKVDLVTLTGPAGTGKTLITLAAGCQQILQEKIYERLIIIKPIQPVGKDLGFLPGTLEEKLEPWIVPIKDNLNFLFRTTPNTSNLKIDTKRKKDDEYYLSLLFEKKVIEIEAVAFIRGRSIPDAFIIIDEAQNLSSHEIKTIITRAGEGTKIVLTGDVGQIDHPQLDVYSNGLTYAIEKFKSQNIAGHVTLLKGERSMLATVASEIL